MDDFHFNEDEIPAINEYFENDLTLDQLKKIQKILTKHTNLKLYGREKSMLPMKQLDCNVCVPCTPQAIPSLEQVVMAITGNLINESVTTQVVSPQKKETTMYKDERTEAQQAKDYLIESLNQAIRTKDSELEKQFYLDGKHGMETFGDLRKAIENGWVQVDESYKDMKDDQRLFDNPVYLIRISDPEKKPDPEGYKKARAEMKKTASDVKDQIVVYGSEKGLEALNAFKAQKFQ